MASTSRSCSATTSASTSGGRCVPNRRNAHEAAQLSEEGMEDRQPGSLDDLQVKLLVEVEKVVVTTLGRSPALPDQDETQVVELRVGHDVARALDRNDLERLAQEQDLLSMLGREASHDQLPSRPDLDQALLQEAAQSLADRRARAAEPPCELRLGENRPRRKLAEKNPVAHVLIREIRELAACHGRRHFAVSDSRLAGLERATPIEYRAAHSSPPVYL